MWINCDLTIDHLSLKSPLVYATIFLFFFVEAHVRYIFYFEEDLVSEDHAAVSYILIYFSVSLEMVPNYLGLELL